MSSKSTTNRWTGSVLLPAALAAFWLLPVAAQSPVDEYGDYSSTVEQHEDYTAYDDTTPEVVILTPKVLAELVGPIALYPDDLLAIVLPASTFPIQIVQAARFLDDYEQDSSLKPVEDWDDSVTALLNYPKVVRMMNEDIEWTWELGGAVLNQQQDVIEAVEVFRDRAYAAGNLKSDDYQTVYDEGESIEIIPADEEVIYVPYYEPERVVIRHVEPAYYYYPQPCPVYYYPYPRGHSFSNGFFWGVTSAYRIGWSTRHLNVRHNSYWGHPYYGHRYSGHYYRQPSVHFYNNWYANTGRYSRHRYRDGDRWRPRRNSGARPGGHRSSGQSDLDGHSTTTIDHGDMLTTRIDDTRDRSDLVRRRASPDRQRVVRDRSQHEPRPTRRVVQVRERPATTAVATRPETRPTVDRRRPNTTANRRPRSSEDDVTLRRVVDRASQREPARRSTTRSSQVSSERRVMAKPAVARVSQRELVRRTTRGSQVNSERRVMTKPAVARRSPPVQREPTRQAKPAVRHEQRRSGNQSGRDTQARREAAQERKVSRTKDQKKPSRERRKKD
ncbi:MAG: DUF3300 domain-containing protein [Gammaproteobacteria bacterium]|nr:DUF3300 domain-containing protein [Gammaproteobacteria bacterium]